MQRSIFEGANGEFVYSEACRAISDFSMAECLDKGVLVGLSGGADSVVLLLFLIEYRKRNGSDFSISAMHVNHGIRGAEADRDEEFSRSLCRDLGVPFFSIKINVPEIAEHLGIGIEEAARNERYSAFSAFISKSDMVKTLSVAHNASDNLETMIFNLTRGSGTKGLSGIPPIRGNVIRPLIYVPKEAIVTLLAENGVQYVTDTTNLSTDYTRNFIRSEIVSRLKSINPAVENAATRLSSILREDDAFIRDIAERVISENLLDGVIENKVLAELPNPVFARAVAILASLDGMNGIDHKHVLEIRDSINKRDFRISLPEGRVFLSERGFSRITVPKPREETLQELKYGENYVEALGILVVISNDKTHISSNVYNFEIEAKFSSDIMNNGLYLRTRRDGDCYVYGGMTRKLKKLFNDASIPPTKRDLIPIFSDKNGIFWVPGFGIRSDLQNGSDEVYIGIYSDPAASCKFYIPKHQRTHKKHIRP